MASPPTIKEEAEHNKLSKKQCGSKFSTVAIQTDFRESETQTDPWDPPIKTADCPNDVVDFLKEFTFGSGLPATNLEVDYILKTRNKINMERKLDQTLTDDAFKKKKQLISGQVRNEWNYKIALLNERQLEKLVVMEESITNEIRKHSERKDQILENLWNKKKKEMNKRSLHLNSQLQKDFRSVESTLLNDEGECELAEEKLSTKPVIQEEFSTGVDFMLSNYYLSNPTGLVSIEKRLQKKANVLKNEIQQPSARKKTPKEKMAESAYRSLLKRKKVKPPPAVHREDREPPQEAAQPTVGAKDTPELFNLIKEEEEKVDPVTVWQKVLRGRAMQKQMLELIEQHKDALSTVLTPLYPELTDS